MKTPFDEVAEIVGIPCDYCNGGAFVILDMSGNVEKLACDCVGETDQYFFYDQEVNK